MEIGPCRRMQRRTYPFAFVILSPGSKIGHTPRKECMVFRGKFVDLWAICKGNCHCLLLASLCEGGGPSGRRERALPSPEIFRAAAKFSPTACGRSPLPEVAKGVNSAAPAHPPASHSPSAPTAPSLQWRYRAQSSPSPAQPLKSSLSQVSETARMQGCRRAAAPVR